LPRAAVAVAFVASGGANNLGHKADNVADHVVAAAVQVEIYNIGEVVLIDYLTGDLPPPEKFSEYLRSSMIVSGPFVRRDPSLDLWGRPYRLEYRDGHPVISSAGADGIFGTDDDVGIQIGRSAKGMSSSAEVPTIPNIVSAPPVPPPEPPLAKSTRSILPPVVRGVASSLKFVGTQVQKLIPRSRAKTGVRPAKVLVKAAARTGVRSGRAIVKVPVKIHPPIKIAQW
jgi:hypothetical protein